MSGILTVPSVRYRRYVLWPLFVLLAVLIGIELKTDILPDGLIGPAALYFVIAAAITGPLRWWRYPVSMVTIVFALCAVMVVGREFTHPDIIARGAIKLMMVVGGSVGLAIGFETAILLFMPIVAALLFTKISALPSSPLIAIALYVALGRRYGFNFLFAKLQAATAVEQDATVIDVPPPLSTRLPVKQLPAFFRLPPAPTLMFQGGLVLVIGSGLLSKQLEKLPDHSILAALAIEGLRVASLVGITLFLIGWVRTRKQKKLNTN